jgi:hypothetical protein
LPQVTGLTLYYSMRCFILFLLLLLIVPLITQAQDRYYYKQKIEVDEVFQEYFYACIEFIPGTHSIHLQVVYHVRVRNTGRLVHQKKYKGYITYTLQSPNTYDINLNSIRYIIIKEQRFLIVEYNSTILVFTRENRGIDFSN